MWTKTRCESSFDTPVTVAAHPFFPRGSLSRGNTHEGTCRAVQCSTIAESGRYLIEPVDPGIKPRTSRLSPTRGAFVSTSSPPSAVRLVAPLGMVFGEFE